MFNNIMNWVSAPASHASGEKEDNKEEAPLNSDSNTDVSVNEPKPVNNNGDKDFISQQKSYMEYANNLSSSLFMKVKDSSGKLIANVTDQVSKSNIVQNIENGIFSEFNKLESEFSNPVKTEKKQHVINRPPWDSSITGLTEEQCDTLKKQIFALSIDEKNFINSIPEGAQFDWTEESMNSYMTSAQLLLEEDKNLAEMRFKIVPRKISEILFWKHYFYRVSVVRQSFQLSVLANTPIYEDQEIPAGHVSDEDILEAELMKELSETGSDHPVSEEKISDEEDLMAELEEDMKSINQS